MHLRWLYLIEQEGLPLTLLINIVISQSVLTSSLLSLLLLFKCLYQRLRAFFTVLLLLPVNHGLEEVFVEVFFIVRVKLRLKVLLLVIILSKVDMKLLISLFQRL